MASFQEIKSNWEYYKTQVPPDYNMSYDYEDVRYTNWESIPIIMPGIKKVLDLFLGKEHADHISLRVLILSKYKILMIFGSILFILISALTIKRIRYNKRIMDNLLNMKEKAFKRNKLASEA